MLLTFGRKCGGKWILKEYKRLFWCAAFAESQEKFDATFVKIRSEDPNCYDYLQDIPSEKWTTYIFPRPRYGHLTSNIQESVNSSWLKARNQPVLHSLLSIWEYVMNLMYQRQRKKHSTERLTDSAWKYIQEVQEKGRRDTVSSSTQNIALTRPFDRFTVSAPQGISHIVNVTQVRHIMSECSDPRHKTRTSSTQVRHIMLTATYVPTHCSAFISSNTSATPGRR